MIISTIIEEPRSNRGKQDKKIIRNKKNNLIRSTLLEKRNINNCFTMSYFGNYLLSSSILNVISFALVEADT